MWTNRAYTMYRYGLHTVRHVVYELRRISPSSSCSSDSVPVTKRQVTKCPRDKMASDEEYPWRNGWRRSVPTTKWLAMKCIRDETAATKRRRWNSSDETYCSVRLTPHSHIKSIGSVNLEHLSEHPNFNRAGGGCLRPSLDAVGMCS